MNNGIHFTCLGNPDQVPVPVDVAELIPIPVTKVEKEGGGLICVFSGSVFVVVKTNTYAEIFTTGMFCDCAAGI